MRKLLIAFDLDGTLLPRVDFIEERTISAVRRARKLGHIPVICTARPFSMFRWIYEAMELDTPVCTINGAIVYNPTDPDFPRYESLIPREIVDKILLATTSLGAFLPLYIECGDTIYHSPGNHSSYYRERIKTSPCPIELGTDYPSIPASRIIISPSDIESARRMAEYVASLDGVKEASWDFLPGTSSPGGLRMSIALNGVDKWNAVEKIASYYGIPTEDIYAFGDMWNDFEMLRRAGHGYALKGSDAEQNSGAKFVTRCTCEECGVADIIEKEILKR